MTAPCKIYKDTLTHTHMYTQRVSILGMGFYKAFHNISQQHAVITLSYRLNIVSVEKQSNRFFFSQKDILMAFMFLKVDQYKHTYTQNVHVYICTLTDTHGWINCFVHVNGPNLTTDNRRRITILITSVCSCKVLTAINSFFVGLKIFNHQDTCSNWHQHMNSPSIIYVM